MKKLPSFGKITPEFFREVIYPRLGSRDKSVIVGPSNGVDFGAFECGGKVVVLSADPFSVAPAFGWERAAWLAVHIIASDVAVSGIPPRYLAVDLNLPPEITEEQLARLWTAVDAECKKIGVNVVTGHTARYPGCNYTMVGGAIMLGVGTRKQLVDRSKVRPGDAVVVSKGPAIETTGIFAVEFPDALEKRFGSKFVREAQRLFRQMSVVKDAAVVAPFATAMHDATEGGIIGGLHELSSKYGMRIEKEKIVVSEAAAETCAFLGIDPYVSISEGTLLATVRGDEGESAVNALKKAGIPASVVGKVVKECGLFVDGRRVEHPRVDPFWAKYEEFRKGGDAIVAEVDAVANALCSTRGFFENIPEIGSNIVFAKPSAKSSKDAAAIEGRMRRGIGRVLRGTAAYGASRHLADIVSVFSKYGVRSALDLAYLPALVDACVRAGLSTVEVSRLEEPERVSSVEGASMPWLASQVIRKHGGAPDVFWSRGSFGKEATVCVLGANPREVLAKTRRAFRTAAY